MLAQKIYNYFSEKEKERKHEGELTFAPSYFCDCLRKVFRRKINAPQSNPISEAAWLKMELGKAVHEKLQNIFKDIGIWEQGEDFKEIEYQGLKFKYLIDGLLKINDKKFICEIKSIYGNGFSAVEKGAKPEHLLQLVLYMEFENIDNGVLIYIGRDNGRMLEYYLQKGDKKYNEMLEKINKGIERFKKLKENFSKYLKENREPERDFQIQLKNTGDGYSENFRKDKVKYKSSWQCSYCVFKDNCWAYELEEIKNNKFYINGVFEGGQNGNN